MIVFSQKCKMPIYKCLTGKHVINSNREKVDNGILEDLIDPITLEILQNPIVIPISGNVYDLDSLQSWFLTSNVEPLTGYTLDENKLTLYH